MKLEIEPKIAYFSRKAQIISKELSKWTRRKIESSQIISQKISTKYKLNKETKSNVWFKLKELYKGKTPENLLEIITDPNFLLNSTFKLLKNKGRLTKGTATPEKELSSYTKEYSNGIKRLEQLPNTIKYKDIKLISKLLSKNKYPSLLNRRKWIPKPNSTKLRPLTIPFFSDRIIQDGIRVILNAIYEPEFLKLNVSFGFREKESIISVIKIILNQEGFLYAIEGDIEGAYDKVDRELLEKILSNKIQDKNFIKLIKRRLRVRVFDETLEKPISESLLGIPQGGIDSPILWNIYFHEFDKKVMDFLTIKLGPKNFLYLRYADDFILFTKLNLEENKILKEEIKNMLYQELKAILSSEKTIITNLLTDSAHFVGFEIINKDNKLKIGPDTNRLKIRNNLKGFTANNEVRNMTEVKNLPKNMIIEFFNTRLRGFWETYNIPGSDKKTLENQIRILYYSAIRTIRSNKKGDPRTQYIIKKLDGKLRIKNWKLLNLESLENLSKKNKTNKIDQTIKSNDFINKKTKETNSQRICFGLGCITCLSPKENMIISCSSTNNLILKEKTKEIKHNIESLRFLKNSNIYIQCENCYNQNNNELKILDHRLVNPGSFIETQNALIKTKPKVNQTNEQDKSWSKKGWEIKETKK